FLTAGWKGVSRAMVSATASQRWFTITDRDTPGVDALLDRTESHVAARVSWRAWTQTVLFAERSTTRYDVVGRQRDAVMESWNAGVRLDAQGPLTGIIQLGEARVDSRDDTWKGARPLIGDANVSFRAGES